MASERLSDEFMRQLEGIANAMMDGGQFTVGELAVAGAMVGVAVGELRERRAADSIIRVIHGQDGGTIREVWMTFREMEALEWLRDKVYPHGNRESAKGALEALDKLLGKGSR